MKAFVISSFGVILCKLCSLLFNCILLPFRVFYM